MSNHCLAYSLISLCLSIKCVGAAELADFSSDGCSLFPDGTLIQQDLWCDCCITHDIAYWQGGNHQQKTQADKALRHCVLQKTGNKLLADTMYYGVIVGGSPVFPVWYRWGYGWPYGRGFQPLNEYEQQQVIDKLHQYMVSMPPAPCDFDYSVRVFIEEKVQELVK